MWIFAYGSLMWDGWEKAYGCTNTSLADLPGYRRVFNKASIKRWGSKQSPCPTLNLEKSASAACRGMAFEFPDGKRKEVLSYLRNREGEGFDLVELEVRLTNGASVTADVPLYGGKNVIRAATAAEAATAVLSAKGNAGPCASYIKGIADKLTELEINDPTVVDLMREVDKLNVPAATSAAAPTGPSALDVFFTSLESRTSDPTHLRLLKAARKSNPAAALEKELAKIMEELLREG